MSLPTQSVTASRAPRILLLYHYFYPDDVVSACHFAELATGLSDCGWEVEARPCNRGCRDERRTYPSHTRWGRIEIRRVWRPRLRQASAAGRLLNALWMIAAWSWHACRPRRCRPDVVLVGTDPVLSILIALPLGCFRRRIRVVHWGFDLYPEAALADGIMKEDGFLVRLLQRLLRAAYRRCHLLADIGPCMGRRLARYASPARAATLVPWALWEPEAPPPRDDRLHAEMFGGGTLGLLYSGNYGRAHAHEDFLTLARRLRDLPVTFGFAVRGNRADALASDLTDADVNVRLLPFVPRERLQAQLSSADIHLVSLRAAWEGVVVPSKFFGAIAAGRPVLFAGPADCAVAHWIRTHGLGWVLSADTANAVANELAALANDRSRLEMLQRHCHQVYREHFSRRKVTAAWDRELRALLGTTFAPKQAGV